MSAAALGLGRIVRADLRHHRRSLAGVFVAIFVASALVTGLGVLVESGIRGGLAPERYTAADLVVGAAQQVDVPEDLPVPLRERALVPADAAREIAALPGVEAVVADVTVPLAVPGGATADAVVEAHPWPATALTGFTLAEGREPAAADEIAVTVGSAHSVGEAVTLAHGGSPATYRVVGVVAAPVAPDRSIPVFLTEDRIADLDPRGGIPHALGVFVDGDPEQAATAIRESFPALVARTGDARGDVEFLDSGAARTLLIAIGSAFVGTCILVALFIVSGTLSLSVQSRRREYALLRAVGATPQQVHALIAREVPRRRGARRDPGPRTRIPAPLRPAVGLRGGRRDPGRLRAGRQPPSRGRCSAAGARGRVGCGTDRRATPCSPRPHRGAAGVVDGTGTDRSAPRHHRHRLRRSRALRVDGAAGGAG
ncbi:hypothetical protein CSX12_00825 [Microbacterium sp. Y-01]|uniref:ABC transporter permease n=1 Tax=Microbacterium sp. Y-01 TaxID=2048898 RepID=UPI000F5EEBFA|nr:FtsX-like permease family protein [Microbacterium sp. Y-01]AZH77104.1 hypothetical protein CSX12_00825 [Microbacterium sp. Y-01]